MRESAHVHFAQRFMFFRTEAVRQALRHCIPLKLTHALKRRQRRWIADFLAVARIVDLEDSCCSGAADEVGNDVDPDV